MTERSKQPWIRHLVVAVPYLWLAVFFLLPFLIVVKISLSQTAIAQPPYVPLLDLTAGWQGLRDFVAALGVEAYRLIATDAIYLSSYLRSMQVAVFSTAILLAIGLPIAYGIARLPRGLQPIFVVLVIVPFWTSLLIRVYAWINILQRDGLLNSVLMSLGVIGEPVPWLATDTAVYIGMVYSYLPFMILPLYASLERVDRALIEAAADLGCPPWKAFWLVTVPLVWPGIAAGVLLCFIPIFGEFVIPDLLGGSVDPLIGQTLWLEFFGNKDWPVASAIAVTLLVLLVGPILLYERQQLRALKAER
jgi:putrescine transport system permease protein